MKIESYVLRATGQDGFMVRRLNLIVALGLLLCACTREPDITRQVPPDQFGFADQFVKQLQVGAVDAALDSLSPNVDRDRAREVFQNIADNFPKRPIIATRVVNWRVSYLEPDGTMSATSTGNPNEIVNIPITLRYVYSDTDALDAILVLAPRDQSYSVSLLTFQEHTQAEIDANAFFAPGKSLVHYVYAFGALCVILLTIAALYFCIRGPGPRWWWRWLWVLFILMGVSRFVIVWTTGDLTIAPLSLVLFNVEFTKAGVYGSWVIYTGIPLGAILYLALYFWRWRKPKKPEIAAPTPAPEKPAETTPAAS